MKTFYQQVGDLHFAAAGAAIKNGQELLIGIDLSADEADQRLVEIAFLGNVAAMHIDAMRRSYEMDAGRFQKKCSG